MNQQLYLQNPYVTPPFGPIERTGIWIASGNLAGACAVTPRGLYRTRMRGGWATIGQYNRGLRSVLHFKGKSR